jgi:hypothetical protein
VHTSPDEDLSSIGFSELGKAIFLDPLPPLGFSTPKKDDDDPASALPLSPPYFAFSPLPSSPFSSIANQSLSVFVFFSSPFCFSAFRFSSLPYFSGNRAEEGNSKHQPTQKKKKKKKGRTTRGIPRRMHQELRAP